MSNKELIEKKIKKVTKNKKIIDAFLVTDRKYFVPKELEDKAYEDRALPIGRGQTISQPSLVALMTSLLHLTGKEKVLEIGTGSGYQAAILSHLAGEVYTLEIVDQLHKSSKKIFEKLEMKNVHATFANGSVGYADKAPYDAIIVTAGAQKVPPQLLEQLKDGGRIVVPLGSSPQELILKIGCKKGNETEFQDVERVQFVPLTGKEGSFK